MKQTLRQLWSYEDCSLYWVATSPYGFPMWRKFLKWGEAASWLKSQADTLSTKGASSMKLTASDCRELRAGQ